MENFYNMQKQVANLIKSDDDECLNFFKAGYQTTASTFLLTMNCNFTPFFSKSLTLPIYFLNMSVLKYRNKKLAI